MLMLTPADEWEMVGNRARLLSKLPQAASGQHEHEALLLRDSSTVRSEAQPVSDLTSQAAHALGRNLSRLIRVL
jgi:hypothetical protein